MTSKAEPWQFLIHKNQRAVAGIVILGITSSGVHHIKQVLRKALREQQLLCSAAGLDEGSKRTRSPKVAVDAVFARRLFKILKICIPSSLSAEAGLIYAQTALLVARTFLTDFTSQIEGGVGRHVSVFLFSFHRSSSP